MKDFNSIITRLFLCLPPGYSIHYIKGAAFSVARLLGPTTITKPILVWSNWLWTRTHGRFNQLSICQSNLIFTIFNKFFWPSKGEGYKKRHKQHNLRNYGAHPTHRKSSTTIAFGNQFLVL